MAPSRAVTLTLPDRVLAALRAIDSDLGRAIVRLTQSELAMQPHAPAELIRFGQRAVIAVRPTRTLEVRTGVTLVPLPDGRALISFDEPLSPADLELTIEDALDDRALSRRDRAVFKAIAEILRAARRSTDVTLQRRNIIVLESRRPARPANATGTRTRRSESAAASRTS